MEIVETTVHRSQIRIDSEEASILKAALNEVCNALAVHEFHTRMGSDRNQAVELLKEFGQLLDRMRSSAPREV